MSLTFIGCCLCLPESEHFVKADGVMNFPRKTKKTLVQDKTSLVCVLKNPSLDKFCLLQRPKTGLLANLLEFPSIIMDLKTELKSKQVKDLLKEAFDIDVAGLADKGEIFHQFSHIKQTYLIWSGDVVAQEISINPGQHQSVQWLTREELLESAISTAMKKVFQHYSKVNYLIKSMTKILKWNLVCIGF